MYRAITRRSLSYSSRPHTPTSIPRPTPIMPARRRHSGQACSLARPSVTESAGTDTVTTTSTSTETSTFQAIPSTGVREINGRQTADRAVRSADPRPDLEAVLAQDLAPAPALGRLCSLGGTYRSKRAEIGAAPLVAVGKRDGNKAMVVRSAITKMAGVQ